MIRLVEGSLFLIPFMLRLTSQAALREKVPSGDRGNGSVCKMLCKQVSSRSLTPMVFKAEHKVSAHVTSVLVGDRRWEW